MARYSEEDQKNIVNKICDWIESGKSLRWCLTQEGTPSSREFYEWIDESEDFRKQYARATTIRADLVFDDILDIADSQEGDVIIVDGQEKVNHDNINRARLRVDARKWMLSKMLPKKYGERLGLDHTGKAFVTPILERGKELPDEEELPEDDILK